LETAAACLCRDLDRPLRVCQFAYDTVSVWKHAKPRIRNPMRPDHYQLAIKRAPKLALALLKMLTPFVI